MKRQLLTSLVNFFLVSLFLCVRSGSASTKQQNNSRIAFPVGEGMIYRAYWGIIPVAYSVVTNEWVEFNGRRCLAIRIRTQSNDFLSKIYPVDDFLESIVDPETFLPLRFTKILREGRYHTHEVTTFDHMAGKAVWHRLKDGKREELAIAPDTRDLLSFMYSMRPQKVFEPGTEIKFQVMADEKIYDLVVRASKIERFRVSRYGWLESLKLQPVAEFGGLFVRHKGDAWVWISLDPRRLITKIAVRLPVANVNIMLSEVTGPGDDFWVKPSSAEELRGDKCDEEVKL